MASKINLGRSTSWTLIWIVFKTSMRFVSNMILSRLLSPEMFGIAAIGNAILSGVSMLSDIGLRQSIVRSHREDDTFFKTAWSIQIVRGIILWMLLSLMAAPLGYFYGSTEVTTFVLIVAITLLSMGLNNVEVHRRFRDSNLRVIALMDITATIIGLSVMVFWATIQPSSVALAVGALVTTSIMTALTLIILPKANCRLMFDKETVRELISFGKWIFISTILAFFVIQLDRLVLGKLVSLQEVGFYSIAAIWAFIPNQILGQWSGQVFFPLVAESVRSQTGIHVLRFTRRVYVAIAALACAVLFAASELIIGLVYPHAYADVAQLMRPLIAVALITTIEQSYSDLLIAYSIPKEKVIGQGISLVIFLALLWPVFNFAGLEGFIFLIGATTAFRCFWFAYRLRRLFALDIWFDTAFFGLFIGGAYVLLQLNDISGGQLNQMAMVAIQGVSAAALSFWLYRKVSRLHTKNQTAI